ncbi:hypothetical protein CR513_05856, partial [Mucuna pruriens]
MELFFKEGDLVWVHLRNERFPHHRKSKLLPKGDDSFKILKRINDNTYKVSMPQEFGGSTQAPNLRSNSLQEMEDDKPHSRTQDGKKEAATPALEGLVTRGNLKRIQEKVQHELAMLKGQEEAQEGQVLYH